MHLFLYSDMTNDYADRYRIPSNVLFQKGLKDKEDIDKINKLLEQQRRIKDYYEKSLGEDRLVLLRSDLNSAVSKNVGRMSGLSKRKEVLLKYNISNVPFEDKFIPMGDLGEIGLATALFNLHRSI